MFDILPGSSEFLSSHWGVVIGIGLLFFLMQIALSVRFYRVVRRQHNILRKLFRDFANGGSGRSHDQSIAQRFNWLSWVETIFPFPAGSTIASRNYSRDDVLAELDTRIASNSDYLLLQRMGIMAPLLGVVLTVIGFFG